VPSPGKGAVFEKLPCNRRPDSDGLREAIRSPGSMAAWSIKGGRLGGSKVPAALAVHVFYFSFYCGGVVNPP